MHVRIQCAFGKIIIVDIPQTSKREAYQKYATIILMTQDIRNLLAISRLNEYVPILQV